MPREIKFRAWDKVNKKMFKVEKLEWYWTDINGPSGMNIEINDDKFQRITGHGMKDFELMQFTTLTTKDGDDLYDGDIIKDEDGMLFMVNWDYSRGCWRVIDIEGYYRGQLFEFVARGCKKVGDCYSDPELLEVEPCQE